MSFLLTGIPKAQKGIIWFLIISADVILVLEIASLFQVFDKPLILFVIQCSLTLLSVLLNKILKAGFPKVTGFQLRKSIIILLQTLKTNRMLVIFCIFVFLNLFLLAVCIVRFPQNITDSLYNHLSRIGYWIQQGSLRHYFAFNNVGMTYPYNNSLMMALPIILLKTDRFVGFVQYFAGLVCVLSCYSVSRMIGFRRSSSLFAALLLLTYPIIIYESITAQNDLLTAAFIVSSFTLLLSYISSKQRLLIIFSLLGLSLAIGTKQYAIIFLPGYVVLYICVYLAAKNNPLKKNIVLGGFFIIFLLLFGTYSNIQNLINYGNPFGAKSLTQSVLTKNYFEVLPARIVINSSRYLLQFIGCEGLPPQLSTSCVELRTRILKPLLAKNVEETKFLYTTIPFRFQQEYLYNAESAWFGPLSWILILPSLVYVMILSIKKRQFLYLVLLIAPISFFFLIQVIANGWEPYQGRFFITAVVILQPFTAWLFDSKKYFSKIITSVICSVAIFIMIYSTLNNASLPLTSKRMMVDLERWGEMNIKVLQKVAYKLKPYIMAEKDVWSMNRVEVLTIGESAYYSPTMLVDKNVPIISRIGIMSDSYDLPDYLFRGEKVLRSFQRITSVESDTINLDYLLLAPNYKNMNFPDFSVVDQSNEWVLLQRKKSY